eukprot:g30303.t1
MNRERYHAASPAFDWSKILRTRLQGSPRAQVPEVACVKLMQANCYAVSNMIRRQREAEITPTDTQHRL